MNQSNRLERLRHGLAEEEIDAILISQPENRSYLSGFDGSAGYLLITPRDAILATDFRYTEQAKAQAPGYNIIRITGQISGWLPQLAADLNLRRLGFEAGHVTYAIFRQLADMPGGQPRLELVPADGVVDTLRTVKEPEELECISRAVAITDSAFVYIEGKICPGTTEAETAWEIEKFMREEGSQGLPFDIIVASGPNSALPHARPTSRPIQAGEPVVIDIGARINGYSGDMTRTICAGGGDATFSKVYDIVLGAQLTALATIQKGMTGDEADRLARVVIEEAGYGEAFGHSLGHGLGLAPHEAPRLGPGSTDTLSAGMVFTIEPSIYLPGWGGVRIEDVAMIENGKVEVISKARKVLI